jgi:hypothetical protein
MVNRPHELSPGDAILLEWQHIAGGCGLRPQINREGAACSSERNKGKNPLIQSPFF